MRYYNVEVRGVLVWVEWTRNKSMAVGELAAWRRVESLVGPLGARLVVREKLDPA